MVRTLQRSCDEDERTSATGISTAAADIRSDSSHRHQMPTDWKRFRVSRVHVLHRLYRIGKAVWAGDWSLTFQSRGSANGTNQIQPFSFEFQTCAVQHVQVKLHNIHESICSTVAAFFPTQRFDISVKERKDQGRGVWRGVEWPWGTWSFPGKIHHFVDDFLGKTKRMNGCYTSVLEGMLIAVVPFLPFVSTVWIQVAFRPMSKLSTPRSG